MNADEPLDLWGHWEQGRWAVIPTNMQTRKNGTAVMGAGLAKQAAERVPELPRLYGETLARGEPFLLHVRRVVLVPTKDHWRDPSPFKLVAESIAWLGMWGRGTSNPMVVPALGCGLGGLDWGEVKPLIEQQLAGCDYVLLGPQP